MIKLPIHSTVSRSSGGGSSISATAAAAEAAAGPHVLCSSVATWDDTWRIEKK